MATISRLKCVATLALAWGLGAGASLVSAPVPAAPGDDSLRSENASPTEPSSRPSLDRTGRKRVGKASFYASRYAGKKMADGTPMRLDGNNAASRTLPLGTTARVTNLETGKSALIRICDRGPYVKGRIVDLSPSTARAIGLERKKGVARVEVAPISVPLANGAVNLTALSM
jgi:rare lipoprotein A